MVHQLTISIGATKAEIDFEYISQGLQGAIFRCKATNKTIEPTDTALKVYFSSGMDLDKLQKIETQLTQQGLHYPVYDWIRLYDRVTGVNLTAKFEEFLSGRRELEMKDFRKSKIREAVAREIARLHGGGSFH